jgi:predicted Zn-dependent protease with MMP-like domain
MRVKGQRFSSASQRHPDYQKNIEEVCSTEAELREQIRRTVIHEGH